MGWLTVLAMATILAGVALVNSGHREEHGPRHEVEREEVAA
jgi:hypothetical protein